MKKQLLIIAIILLQVNLFAQQNYVHYTIKDGLSQMQCMRLFQDSKGFIWIGTKAGISKYDGIHFKNYSLDKGLPDSRIYAINEDNTGGIWVLTNSGLSVLKNEEFVFYPPKDKMYFKHRELIIDNNQGVWLIEGAKKNRIINFTNGKYKTVFLVNENSKTTIRHLSYDKVNDKLCFSEEGLENSQLHILKNGKLQSKKYANSSFHPFYKEDVAIETHYKKGIINGYSLYQLHNTDTIELYQSKEKINLIKHINDSTYVFTNNGFQANMPLYYLINGKLQEHPSRFDQINDFLQDTEGNMWVASEKGLYKITPFNNYTQKDNMPDYVWAIQEDKNGKIWFASYNDDHLYYLENGTIYKHTKKFHTGGFFMGAIQTQNRDILFPYYSGMIQYNGNSFSEIPLGAASLSVYEDPQTLKQYYGSFKGLITKDKKGNTSINKRFSQGQDEVIRSFAKNRKGEIWFATNKTFGILNQKDTLVFEIKELKGAMCLYNDYKDNLWIGTNSGLFHYDYKKITRLKHPELNDMIGTIIATDSTHFVYGGLRGIGIFDVEKFYKNKAQLTSSIDALPFVDYYTQSHGFLGEEIGQNGALQDSKGQIWLATNNSVVMFDPKNLSKNFKPPYTYITNFKTSSDNINWESNSDSIARLNHKNKNIRFDFTGISHTAPNMVKYKYRLKGFSDKWSKETKERYVIFTNLDAGDYSFELLASNNNGVWNKEAVVKYFSIIPAWWQQVWFRIIASLLLLFLVYKLVQYQYQRIKRKTELEERLNKLQQQSIQSQLYPHLLFNTASAAGSVIYKEDKDKAYDFVVKLSQFMRRALEDSKKLYKSLQEEIDFVETYLEIQKIRFSERFEYKINIDKEVNTSLQVPQMIIQTYVENAVKHGLEPLKKGGLLEIKISKKENEIYISIIDNGIGIKKAKKLASKGTGSGVKIMNEIYDLHNQKGTSIITYQLIDLYARGEKGTQSIIRIKIE